MDDIWSVEAWDEIRAILPDDGNGSRVILTTRLTDVAAYPDPRSPLHEMRLMDEIQSCHLLRKKVFGPQDCPLELERIVEEIARNCRGLPLAVVVVAGMLSTVGENPASWKAIAEDVRSAVTSKGQFESILSLSYTHLPHYLRPCFLYMGMFPQDHEICASKLILLWVAENFVRHPDGSKSLEEEAKECLKDLVRRNLVFVNKRKFDGEIKSCSLHDLMRDLCVRKAHEGKFFLDFGGWHDRRYFPLAIRENQRRVSVSPSGLPYLSKIDSLTIHTIMCFHVKSVANMLERFGLLRVLDVGDVYVRSLPYELFDLLNLVYLSIYYHGRIPAAISKLHNL
ncbi:putative late blight resistance protein homolog R1A-10 [Salvia splendens]|uniref:putative late blight resistance protein homolog R1A-10 n=1 Tax=Salvia splendens TaxID=180675 RepID=UPI001C27EAE8|nr:putative late blight resistance protein homolog R1A-10 [Salvia splendens]XP_042055129.1 putative late blight resistance protein homolog R1A-10 [Salvia splendens]